MTPRGFEDTLLDAGPDAPFANNARAFMGLRALAVPDGVHNREQRRALAKATRKAMGRTTLTAFERLVVGGGK